MAESDWCQELVPLRPGCDVRTLCGLARGHTGGCHPPDKICCRCDRTEQRLREGPWRSMSDSFGYGPDGQYCLSCWGDYLDRLPRAIECYRCRSLIDPCDVTNLDYEYVCVQCEPNPYHEA